MAIDLVVPLWCAPSENSKVNRYYITLYMTHLTKNKTNFRMGLYTSLLNYSQYLCNFNYFTLVIRLSHTHTKYPP